MKRLFVSLLFMCFLCMLTIYPVTAGTVTTETVSFAQLSSLNDKQCEEFLLSYGITIPEELDGIKLKKLISLIEENPEQEIVVEYPILARFAEDVRSAVRSYYGLTTTNRSSPRYTLLHSTLHSWDASTMPNYNCYAYAIGRTTWSTPGEFSGGSYNGNADINTLAYTIRNDLTEGLGYSCTYVSATLTTSGEWHNVISIRKDTEFDVGYNDYHVARRNGGNWYHKPGGSAILKFNSASAQVAEWTNEGYNGLFYVSPTITYDSDLLYISYKTTHGGTMPVQTGVHYHKGSYHYYQYANVCLDCDEHLSVYYTSVPCSGPPCLVVMPTAASANE